MLQRLVCGVYAVGLSSLQPHRQVFSFDLTKEIDILSYISAPSHEASSFGGELIISGGARTRTEVHPVPLRVLRDVETCLTPCTSSYTLKLIDVKILVNTPQLIISWITWCCRITSFSNSDDLPAPL